MSSTSQLRILLGYSHYASYINVGEWVDAWLSRLRPHGIQADSFCLTLDPPGPRLSWRELDARWSTGDQKLLAMYERLLDRLRDYDVFVNWNGINLHPEFVKTLPVFSVYGCFDDPESSDTLSRPVAAAYDLCMVGNVAELDAYRSWGAKEVAPWPNGFRADEFDPHLTREAILHGKRDIDIVFICDRNAPWRRERVDAFAKAFPQGAYYGTGWPNGVLPEAERVPMLQRAKIGINIHNSTGPINFRTFYLPANGVLQICDNKSHLGTLFELDKEVVGFNTIEEAIERCAYYLEHDEERRQIAAAGWARALRDYNEVAVFQRMVDEVAKRWTDRGHAAAAADNARRVLASQQAIARKMRRVQSMRPLGNILKAPVRKGRSVLSRIVRRIRGHA